MNGMGEQAIVGSLWRHTKSGHNYVVLGACQLEATNRPAVLYRSIDDVKGLVWARDEAEFCDGRFVHITVT